MADADFDIPDYPETPESIAAARQAQVRERAAAGANADGRIQVADNGEPDPERKPAC